MSQKIRRILAAARIDEARKDWRERGGVVRSCSVCGSRVVLSPSGDELARVSGYEVMCVAPCYAATEAATLEAGNASEIHAPDEIPSPAVASILEADFRRRIRRK